MAIAPDLAGFADAQRRLRAGFGEPCTFYEPPVETYPPGTPVDPETGRPYDPKVTPTDSTQGSAVVNCDVQFRAISRSGTGLEEIQGAAGLHDSTHMMLIADIADRASCEAAVEVDVRGMRCKIMAQKPDGIGGIQRWLVYVRQK